VHAHVVLSLGPERDASWIEIETHSVIASVLSSRGEWAEAGEHLSAAQARAAETEFPIEVKAIVRLSQATAARARGDSATIIEVIGPMLGVGHTERPSAATYRRIRRQGLGILWWPLLIEALLDTGDTTTAARQFDEFRAVVPERHPILTVLVLALQARLSAASGQPDQAVAQFREAAELAGPGHPLLDRALMQHALGRLLQARGDRRGAVDEFRAAHELLTGLGAAPYLARVEADLAATGMPLAVPRQATPLRQASPLDLTGREADVVALVAKGMTNTEVAAELYVSTHTVEYHLRNVFAKLGITSRRELRRFAR
jgi:ATP/maltotriose-dependent transcriptional regulator MalT